MGDGAHFFGQELIVARSPIKGHPMVLVGKRSPRPRRTMRHMDQACFGEIPFGAAGPPQFLLVGEGSLRPSGKESASPGHFLVVELTTDSPFKWSWIVTWCCQRVYLICRMSEPT